MDIGRKGRGLAFAGLAGLSGFFAAPAAGQEPVPPIVLQTTTQAYDPVRYEAAYMIAEAWRALGLEVSVEPTDFPALVERVYQAQDFDAAMIGWSGRIDRLDPQFYLGLFDSRQSGPASNNAGGYFNPRFDALYDAQARTFDPEERAALVREAQALAVSDAPLAVLFYRDELVAYDSGAFAGLEVTAGDGLYSEWNLMHARPLTDRATLHIGGPQGPDSLNPLASTTVWGWRWMRMYYDTLLRLSLDAEPVPWAARSVTALDETIIEANLREDMVFHDGAPVTAEDVAFSFSYFVEQGFQYFDAYLAPLAEVEAVDSHTVRFTLREPSASFATIALSQIPILPRHIWEEIENPGQLAPADIPVIGSGPFVFERYVPDEIMSLTRNESHFYAGTTSTDGLLFVLYPDNDAVVAGLLAHEIDMIAWPLVAAQADIVAAQPGFELVTAPDFGFQHLSFNTRRHAFADPAFRRALVRGIDRQRIVDVLLEGRATLGGSVIAPVNAFWHNPDVENLNYDRAAARAELEAAGYRWDTSGRLLRP